MIYSQVRFSVIRYILLSSGQTTSSSEIVFKKTKAYSGFNGMHNIFLLLTQAAQL